MRVVTYNVLGLQGYPPGEALDEVGSFGSEAHLDHFAGVFAELDADILALEEGDGSVINCLLPHDAFIALQTSFFVIFLARWRWSTDCRARRRPSPSKILFAPPSPRSNSNQRWPAPISLPRGSFVCFPGGSARRPSARNDARRLACSRRKVAAFLRIGVIYRRDLCGSVTVVTWRARRMQERQFVR